MSEWWTYRPSDFLLFAPRVYYRLIETHNAALWPLHLLALALGLAVIAVVIRARPAEGRAALVGLGTIWLVVGWAFLWSRYATINWAASTAALLYAVQGAALIAAGALVRAPLAAPPRGARAFGGMALLALGVAFYPLAASASGRSFAAAEIFGIAPDPTAIATLGVLLLVRRKLSWALAPLPLLWCLFSGMTLWTMDAAEAWALFAAAAVWIAIAVTSRGPEAR